MGDTQLLTRLAEERTLLAAPQNVAERFYDSVGLMRGTWSPVGRMALGFAIGSGLMWAIRPSCSFGPDGEPLPVEETSLPWWALPSVLAVYSGVFV